MTGPHPNPELVERLKANTDLLRLAAEMEARLAFLRFQARMPLRPLLLGTTAILTGKVRT